MNNESRPDDTDDLVPPLDAALRATLAEPVPADAVDRVKLRARRLALPSSASPPRTQHANHRRWPVSRTIAGGVAAVAAMLFIVLGLTTWLDRSGGQAIAQVIEKIKAANSVQCKMTTRFGKQPEMSSRLFLEGSRIRIEHFRGTLVQVGDFDRKLALFLDTQRKLAQPIELDPQIAKQFANPIDQLRHLKLNDAERIGEEDVQGHRTQVYRLRKMELLGMRGDGEMLVSVDIQSHLPAKIICHDPDPQAETEIRFEGFVWNQPLDAGLFSLTVPDGFQRGKVVTTPNRIETTPPGVTSPEANSAFADGVLSADRVPGRIVWGRQGTTLTALMRDPEAAPPQESKSHELRQWDVTTGRLRWSQAVAGAGWLAGTADGKFLAAVIGYEVQLRDAASGKIIRKWTADRQLSPLAFAPDGKTLAAGIAEWAPGGKESPGGIRIWDVEQGTLIRTIADDKPLAFVRYSVDGRRLATTSNSGPVKLWDTTTGQLVRIFPGVFRADFSPDGRTIACPANEVSDDKTVGRVNLYDLLSGKLVNSLTSEKAAGTSTVLWVAFSPDGRRLSAADWNGTVTLWDVATGRRKELGIKHEAGVHTVEFSPNGAIVATGCEDKMLHLWKLPVDTNQPVPDKK